MKKIITALATTTILAAGPAFADPHMEDSSSDDMTAEAEVEIETEVETSDAPTPPKSEPETTTSTTTTYENTGTAPDSVMTDSDPVVNDPVAETTPPATTSTTTTTTTMDTSNDADTMDGDILSQKETLELVRAYYRLGERPRRRLLELAKALESDQSGTGAA